MTHSLWVIEFYSSMASKSDLLSTARFFVDFSLKVGEGGRLEHVDDSSLMTSSVMTSSVYFWQL